MNIFRIIACIFFSYFLAFTNDGYSQCEIKISNTQCKKIGIYNEEDSLLTTMDRGPYANAPDGSITPEWTDPTPLADNETRTYIIKEVNFVLTKKTVTCENNEITTSNPYADGCQDGIGLGIYTNTGCRTMTMITSYGEVIRTLAPGEADTLTSTNFIYIFLVGNDTIDILSDEGGDIDSGGCGSCFATITNTVWREIDIYNEADSLLTTLFPGLSSGEPNQPQWTDPRPLAENETRTYILKTGNFELTRKTVTCANKEITTINEYGEECFDGLCPGIYTNTGCSAMTIVSPWSVVVEVLEPGDSAIIDQSLYIFLVGNDTIDVRFMDDERSGGSGIFNVDSGGCEGRKYEFSGNAFIDKNTTCVREAEEPPLRDFNIIVRAFPSGETFETSTDSLGDYYLQPLIALTDTIFEIGYTTDLNLGQLCGNNFSLRKSASELSIQQDFAINLVEACPKLTVDIGTVRLRRCFNNTYFVKYFNYSTDDIEDVSITVALDPFLVFQKSDVVVTTKEDNVYEFPIGTLKSGESGQFSIEVEVSCEAALGQTHCVEARIFPEYNCDQVNENWSGATIQVLADCVGDSVELKIENVSDFPMTQENSFVVTEDVLMLRQGTFQLGAQEVLTLTYLANGATYRLAAEQVRFNPKPNEPSVSIEGCGGINTTGLVNAFPQDDEHFDVSIDCQENIGSYDPNDKSATPSGWGTENYLAKNTDIEYRIRFQNTGTDTAFKVVIVDTLSSFLDATTIVPGAASHAYSYQQYLDDSTGLSIIQFTFEDILLPDSTTNLAGSNGFVKFKIAQLPDLSDELIIENKAAIFFDFNDPIITNIVLHTIGEPFGRIISNTKKVLLPNRAIIIQPNPFSESTLLSISGNPINRGTLHLFNTLGQVVQQQTFSGNQIILQRKDLSSGVYFYTINADNQLITTGKVQVSQE